MKWDVEERSVRIGALGVVSGKHRPMLGDIGGSNQGHHRRLVGAVLPVAVTCYRVVSSLPIYYCSNDV